MFKRNWLNVLIICFLSVLISLLLVLFIVRYINDQVKLYDLQFWLFIIGEFLSLTAFFFVIFYSRISRLWSKTELEMIWKKFHDSLPTNIRIRLRQYYPIIMIGDEFEEKKQLIDNFTAWKSVSDVAQPDYIPDSRLPLFLTQNSFVQAIPSSVLWDDAYHTGRSLKRLWRNSLTNRSPRVMLVVNIEKISKIKSSVLLGRAEKIKEKIKTLDSVKRISEIYIVVTGMDSVIGYSAFADFLLRKKIPFEILSDLHGKLNVQKAISDYESYLSQALLTLNADDFLKIISFFLNAPGKISPVTDFIVMLRDIGDIKIKRLFLTSIEGIERENSNPFSETGNVFIAEKFRPIKQEENELEF